MPAAGGDVTEELTEAQENALEAKLLALRTELEAFLSSTTGGSKPVDLDEPIGRVSRMDAIQQQQMAREQRRRVGVRLEQVKSALGRIDDGEYGDCVLCDEPIKPARLQAKPETPLCVRCQEGRERR